MQETGVEIDLSGLRLGQINDPATFEQAVLSDPATRSWIRSLRGEMLIKRAEAELVAEVARCNDQWELEQAPLRMIEKAKRVEQEAKVAELALIVHRNHLPGSPSRSGHPA